jgi:hypothetical protein
MNLCETLHGRRPWPEFELPWKPMGSSPERGRRGKGEEAAGVRSGELLGEGEGPPWGMRAVLGALLCCSWSLLFVLVREKQEWSLLFVLVREQREEGRRMEKERRKEKEGKEKKRKEKKKKNMEKNLNLKIFGKKIKDNL